jgi:anti-sigma factor RsiW
VVQRPGAELGGGATRGEQPYKHRWPWIAAAAGVLLAIVLAGKLPMGRAPDSGQLIAQEILDSHLRSMMPGHLTDLESSGANAVKRWFNGKVDVSPPVEDLSAEGFPLVGGRLDSISGRTVAALVYRRNQHVINVYSWPSAMPLSAAVSSTRDGYHLIHWTQAGSVWWLVSDLEEAELQHFAALLRRGAQ